MQTIGGHAQWNEARLTAFVMLLSQFVIYACQAAK